MATSVAEHFDMCYKKIYITHDGDDAIHDVTPTKRHLLIELRRESCTLSTLIARVRSRHHEYKHVQLKIFIVALTEMIKQGYINFK